MGKINFLISFCFRYIREGQYARLPDLPYIPGSDASGIVEKVGSDVHDLEVGQRVFVTGRNSGAYAEFIVTESICVFPLHSRLSFAQGAALGTPYFTAYRALIMGAKVLYFNGFFFHNLEVRLIIGSTG